MLVFKFRFIIKYSVLNLPKHPYDFLYGILVDYNFKIFDKISCLRHIAAYYVAPCKPKSYKKA